MTENRDPIQAAGQTVTEYAVHCGCCGATLVGYETLGDAVQTIEEMCEEDGIDPELLSVNEVPIPECVVPDGTTGTLYTCPHCYAAVPTNQWCACPGGQQAMKKADALERGDWVPFPCKGHPFRCHCDSATCWGTPPLAPDIDVLREVATERDHLKFSAHKLGLEIARLKKGLRHVQGVIEDGMAEHNNQRFGDAYFACSAILRGKEPDA